MLTETLFGALLLYPFNDRDNFMVKVYPDGKITWPNIGKASVEETKQIIAALEEAVREAECREFKQWS